MMSELRTDPRWAHARGSRWFAGKDGGAERSEDRRVGKQW